MRMCLGKAWVAVGVVGLFVAGCSKPPEAPQMPPAAVTVANPIEREVQEWDEYPGRLEAKEIVEIRARVSGYITSVSFNEGGDVKQNDVLFVIDRRPYQAELDRTRGEVERARAKLALAEAELKRTEKLVPTQAASELELEERKANLAEAKAAISVAEAEVDAAKLNVEFTEVRAPISGRISRINVTAGNLVTGGGASGGGGQTTLLTTITSMDPIYCYVDADERSVLKYQRLARENRRPSAREGARVPAKLALLNESEFLHDGYIDFVDNRVDPTTGTLRARGRFDNPDGVMTPGLFGRLRVPGVTPYRTLLVNELAIQSDQNQKYVLTVDEKNVVHITPVVTGAAFGNLRAIQSGLTGNERIIVNGILRARPGLPVSPQMAPMPGAQDAEALATTRMVEPPPGSATETSAPTTAPTTRPALREDRAAEPAAAPAARAGGGQSGGRVKPIVGVMPAGVGE